MSFQSFDPMIMKLGYSRHELCALHDIHLQQVYIDVFIMRKGRQLILKLKIIFSFFGTLTSIYLENQYVYRLKKKIRTTIHGRHGDTSLKKNNAISCVAWYISSGWIPMSSVSLYNIVHYVTVRKDIVPLFDKCFDYFNVLITCLERGRGKVSSSMYLRRPAYRRTVWKT